jgi:Tol biopolymer transport system component
LRLYLGFVLLIGLIATIGIVGSWRTDDEAPPQAVSEESRDGVNLIAFVSHDGEVWTTTPDGSDKQKVSPQTGGFFTWPTWSPDASRIVFSAVTGTSPSDSTSSLLAFDLGSDGPYEIYAGEPGVPGLLAVGVVHYPQWSPDSERLAFVAVTSTGLNLFIDDLSDDVGAEFVLDNGPVWITWSPDSQYLFVHRGPSHFLVDTKDGIQVNRLDIPPSGYRVPAWRTDGEAVTIAVVDVNGDYTIYSADVAGGEMAVPEPMVSTPPQVAFLWSPTGEYLALAGSSQYLVHRGSLFNKYERLTLFPRDGTEVATQIQRSVLSFFWSPDGSKLAYVTTTEDDSALRWMILDAENGSEWHLVDFVPSREQLSVYEFFDQYAYSHSPWSPDSRSLVFAGTPVGGGTTASYGSGQAPRYSIVTVDTSPTAFVNIIAEGILGFWSPR